MSKKKKKQILNLTIVPTILPEIYVKFTFMEQINIYSNFSGIDCNIFKT